MAPSGERERYVLSAEFEGYIRRHEADQNAHAAERHRQNDDLVGRFLSMEADISSVEKWQTAHDIKEASKEGELKGVLTTIRLGFATLGILIMGFGSAGLAIWWSTWHR